MANASLNQTYSDIIGSTVSQVFTDIVGAIILLLVGFVVGRIAGKLLQRFLHDLALNSFLKKHLGASLYLEQTLSIIISYGAYLITIILALNYVGLTYAVLQFLSAVVVLIIALFILLSVKDFFPNLFVGVYIHAKGRVRVGRTLQIKNTTGKILEAGLLETKIQTKKGELIIIPNVLFLNEQYRITK